MADQPKTEKELCLYRASIACRVGMDALNGTLCMPLSDGIQPMEFAIFNLLSAVKEIASAIGEDK